MEKTEQTCQTTNFAENPIMKPGYLSVREAAEVMGVSMRSVYGYIDAGKIASFRVGNLLAVEEEEVRLFKRKAAGRPRLRTPSWHMPLSNNLQYLTCINVSIYQDRYNQLFKKLEEIRTRDAHVLRGTVARYIVRNQIQQNELQIVLVWRRASMPTNEEREAALEALKMALADEINWETATYEEGQVIMNA